MLPVLPKLSQRFGAVKASFDKGLRGVATVATTFNNLNKKEVFRKNLFILSGNSGSRVNFLYIGERLNEKTRPLKAPTLCSKKVHEVNNATS